MVIPALRLRLEIRPGRDALHCELTDLLHCATAERGVSSSITLTGPPTVEEPEW